MLALPIFPGRYQPSIVSRNELNYRVRNGNGWTLALISTNYVIRYDLKNKQYYIVSQEICQVEFVYLLNFQTNNVFGS